MFAIPGDYDPEKYAPALWIFTFNALYSCFGVICIVMDTRKSVSKKIIFFASITHSC